MFHDIMKLSIIIMAPLRSKKGHIATAIFYFFFSFFSFSLTLGFSSLSRKLLVIKLPNLNIFVSVKNGCSKKNFPPGLRAFPGTNTVRKHMRRMIGRTVSQFVAKFYQKIPSESALNHYKKIEHFPQMGDQEKNEILPKMYFFKFFILP